MILQVAGLFGLLRIIFCVGELDFVGQIKYMTWDWFLANVKDW